MFKRIVAVALTVLLLTAAPASAATRSGTIALDPLSTLVSGPVVRTEAGVLVSAPAVIDATASGLRGGESILVRLWCYQGSVLLFEEDAGWSPFNNNPPPTVWAFPISGPATCQAQVWYQNPNNHTHAGDPVAPLTPLLVFTAV